MSEECLSELDSDKLEIIKGYREAIGDITDDEFKWLISELAKQRRKRK